MTVIVKNQAIEYPAKKAHNIAWEVWVFFKDSYEGFL